MIRDIVSLQNFLTLVVIVFILAPIPPSTIIGMAIVSHPRTNRYMNPQMIAPVLWLTSTIKGLVRS